MIVAHVKNSSPCQKTAFNMRLVFLVLGILFILTDNSVQVYCETDTTTNHNTTTPTTLALSTGIIPTEAIICCPTKTVRGIVWEEECSEKEVFKKCPPGTEGEAVWYCDLHVGKWMPDMPDYGRCKSFEMAGIINSINTSNPEEALDILIENPIKHGGDMIVVTRILQEVINSATIMIENSNDPSEKKTIATDVTNKTSTVGDNMISDKILWNDLTKETRAEVGTELMREVEKASFLFGSTMNTGENETFVKNSFSQQITKLGTVPDEGLELSLPLPNDKQTATFKLPKGFENALNNNGQNSPILSFFDYYDLQEILLQTSQQVVTNITGSLAVNSHVLSVSLNNNNGRIQLPQNATFFLPHSNPNADQPICAFWSMTSFSWETEGCFVVRTTDSYTECACDHLTHFGVLMDVHGALSIISSVHLTRLELISRIGCIISIVFLAITLIVVLVYRELRRLTTTVQMNLCLCLLIGELFFVAAIQPTDDKNFCKVTAVVLHYFFTAAFSWMLLQAAMIYLLLYKRFDPSKKTAASFYAFGYGVPFLIVTISMGSRFGAYGNDTYCWLSIEHGMRWSFVAPVMVILMINFLALSYALYIAKQANKGMRTRKTSSLSKYQNLILGALTLVPVLGCTWIFGFFMVDNNVGVFFMYAFSLLNSLQGVAIFVVQCLVNPTTRQCLQGSLKRYTILVRTLSRTLYSTPPTGSSLTTRNWENRDRSSVFFVDGAKSGTSTTDQPNPWVFSSYVLNSSSGRFSMFMDNDIHENDNWESTDDNEPSSNKSNNGNVKDEQENSAKNPNFTERSEVSNSTNRNDNQAGPGALMVDRNSVLANENQIDLLILPLSTEEYQI